MIEYLIVIIAVVGCGILIKNLLKKPEENVRKRWMVFEHNSGYKDGEMNKCYYAKDKTSELKSPCFEDHIQLNKWTQNAKQISQKLH